MNRTKNLKKILNNFSNKTKWKELIIIASIFCFSMLIRIIGLKHGFPLLTHPDEAISLYPVLKMTSERWLNPGVFNRPDQIMSYLNLVYLNIISFIQYGEDFAIAFLKHTLNFYFYARILISFLGSLIPVLAYKIGKELKSGSALIIALVFTFFPSYTLHSLYITPDIPITLFTLVVMFFTIRYLNENNRKFIYFATVFAAINTAEKYPGLISLGIVFLGILINNLEHSELSIKARLFRLIKQVLIMTLVFIGVLFIVAPFLFIEYKNVIDALLFESRGTHLGADNLGWWGNLSFYIQSFSSWTNILTVIWVGLGIFTLFKSKDKVGYILFYGVFYSVIMSALSLHWERWALPMYITPLLLTSIGISFTWRQAKRVPKVKYIAIAIICVFFFYQLVFTIYTPIKMSYIDTRVKALDYCHEHNITTENTIFEGYTPLYPQGPKTIFSDDINNAKTEQFVILSSGMYERFYNESERYKNQVKFYENVKKNHKLLAKFEPYPDSSNCIERLDSIVYYMKDLLNLTNLERYQGPVILIYQLSN